MCVHTRWLVYTHTSVITFNIIGTMNTSYYLHLQLEPHPMWLILTFLPYSFLNPISSESQSSRPSQRLLQRLRNTVASMKMFAKSEFRETQPHASGVCPSDPWALRANGLTFPQVILLQETACHPTWALGVPAHFLLYLVP